MIADESGPLDTVDSTVHHHDSNNSSHTATTQFLPFLKNDASRKAFGVFVFVLAGLCEIGGGWLVWQTVRVHKQWWLALLGSLVLVGYGFVATLQPMNDFGRVYAVYGAFFILLSFLWGFVVDGLRLDNGDYIGVAIVLVGTLVMFLWPRAG